MFVQAQCFFESAFLLLWKNKVTKRLLQPCASGIDDFATCSVLLLALYLCQFVVFDANAWQQLRIVKCLLYSGWCWISCSPPSFYSFNLNRNFHWVIASTFWAGCLQKKEKECLGFQGVHISPAWETLVKGIVKSWDLVSLKWLTFLS